MERIVEDEDWGRSGGAINKTESSGGLLINNAMRQQEIKLQNQLQGVLVVQARYKIEDIQNLHVNKGKEPILELEFRVGGKPHSEKI